MQQRYKELDVLRGCAALMVVLFHFTIYQPASHLVFKYGVTGVDLFFLISGFVIFMSISKVSSGKEFVINRLSRLYPTYWACVTFTTLAILVHYQFFGQPARVPLLKYLANMTMFQRYFAVKNIDEPYWTMLVEMTFYIFIFILFQLKWLKSIVTAGIFFLVFILIYQTLLLNYLPKIYKILNIGLQILNHFPLFFAGILFYKVMNEKQSPNWYYIILLLCLALQICLYDNGGTARLYLQRWQYATALICYFTVFLFFVKNKLRFIINTPSIFFGKISFSLYLVHQFIGVVVIIPLLRNYAKFPFWPAALVALLMVILIAWFITVYVEVPLGKKMNLYLRKKWNV